MEDIKLDAYHFHEAVDRVEMVRELLENSILGHAVICDDEELICHYDKVQDSLAILQHEIENKKQLLIDNGFLSPD